MIFTAIVRCRLLRWTAAGFLTGLSCGLLLLDSEGASAEAAYQTVEVTDAGSIAGEVMRPSGEEESEYFPVNKDYDACGKESRRIDWVRVKDGRLLDAVVFIDRIGSGEAFMPAIEVATLQQHNCVFDPTLQIVHDGGTLELRNLDPVMHNARVYETIQAAQRQILNAVQEPGADPVSSALRATRGNAIKIECIVHDFMHAWIFVARNPYYVIVAQHRAFNISNVPPG